MKKNKRKAPQAAKSNQYKLTNWSSYNQSLKSRGSLEVWVARDICSQWYYKGSNQQGAQYKYSNTCIEVAMVLRQVYNLPYRQLEGFLSSLVSVTGWNVEVPHYSNIQRRSKSLDIEVKLKGKDAGQKKYIVIDSTGLKVYGEGEWKVRMHGWNKHRTWMKLHVAVDESTALIESCELTTNAIHDSDMVEALLEQVKGKISKVAGDGAYDKKKVYKFLAKHKIKPVIPPQKRARISKHGNTAGKPLPRDENIRGVRKLGRKKWKQQINYHRRSIAESTMFRYKNTFGGKLRSRTTENQITEVKIKCKILNTMTKQGMPMTVKVKRAA